MNIVFSADNNNKIMVLPVVPKGLKIKIPRKNQEFETINNGIINLIGDRGLKPFPISSFFPTKKYKWAAIGSDPNGWNYVDFFNECSDNKIPIRIIITTKEGIELLNMACTVESFEYGLKLNDDIEYSLDLKEYIFIKKVN